MTGEAAAATAETVVIDGITLNALDENGQPKSAKQLTKEAAKAAKLAKLAQKNEKKAAAAPANKEKAEVSGELVDDETVWPNCDARARTIETQHPQAFLPA